MKAGGTDPAGIEGVPLVAADAGPNVVLAWRPSAERTTNAWTVRNRVFVAAGFAIEDGRGIVDNGSHGSYWIIDRGNGSMGNCRGAPTSVKLNIMFSLRT